jgi:hypothetical protein
MSTKQSKSKSDNTTAEQISYNTKEPIPKYDNRSTSTSGNLQYILTFIAQLIKFYGLGLIKTFPMETLFILGFIIYTIIISSLFLKNPFDWLNESNSGGIIFLSLFGGFLIVITYFFYSKKKQVFDNEENTSAFSYFGKIISTSIFIIFTILMIYLLFNFAAYFSDWSKYIFLLLNLFIFVGIITIILKFFGLAGQGEPSDKESNPSWFKLIFKIFLYLPCLILQFMDYLKFQYSITTKPIVLLLISEILLISIYFLLPMLINAIMTHNSSFLIKKPINTDHVNTLGTFQDINFIPNIGNDTKEFSYKYAVSAWLFLDSFPPETNPSYSEYTSLLNIGDKPNIFFNVLKNKLKIMLKTQDKNERILFETKKFNMQKWNHLVINYDGSTLDIFINNQLVSSTPGIVPYNNNTLITSGSVNGIKGGICNVRYFRDDISRSKINWLYNSVKELNPPII